MSERVTLFQVSSRQLRVSGVGPLSGRQRLGSTFQRLQNPGIKLPRVRGHGEDMSGRLSAGQCLQLFIKISFLLAFVKRNVLCIKRFKDVLGYLDVVILIISEHT